MNYTYYGASTQEERDLTGKIFNDVNLSDLTAVLDKTNSVLELPFDEQIKIVHCVVDTLYGFDDSIKNKNIEKFLAQPVFSKHREIIFNFVVDLTEEEKEAKIKKFELEFNIKLQDGDKLE